jgi:outer membrane protein OmpA-like peptidoglycan-associated protein
MALSVSYFRIGRNKRDPDGDGIIGGQDKCPNQPEDMDGYEDSDGCPDFDNDGDGIPDIKDKCPDHAEDSDGYEDSDGCPDFDNDGDGIPDSSDKCPGQKEIVNGFLDSDGCPDQKPKEIKKGRTILGNVRFIKGTAMWTSESTEELDVLIQSMKAFPNIKIEIQGHTDSFGSRSKNQELSEKMAHAVMDYLIKKGVESSRLTAIGFGEERPVAPNTSAEGRESNRRIEIFRTN